MPQLALAQGLGCLFTGLQFGGVVERLTQAADRHVGLLRQEERFGRARTGNGTVYIRPKPGDRAKQGRFADTRAATNQD